MSKMRVAIVGNYTLNEERKLPLIRHFLPSLGAALVAAMTPDEFNVEILDERDINYKKDFDLIGISVNTTSFSLRAYQISKRFRGLGKTVILGGLHVTLLPFEAAEHADAVVVGPAEGGAWKQVLEDFKVGALRRFYFGSTYHYNRFKSASVSTENNTYVADCLNEEFPTLTGLPKPRQDLGPKTFLTPVQATRGCPNHCGFCVKSVVEGKTHRKRPLKEVINEIKGLPSLKPIIFVDNSLLADSQYALDMFRELKKLKRRWICATPIERLIEQDGVLLEKAANSGCIAIEFGFETLNPSANLIISTEKPPSKYQKAIKEIHKKGITIIGTFVFGFDDDDGNTIKNTIRFIEENKIELPSIHILTPFPGTHFFNELDNEGRILHYDWSKYDTRHVVFKPRDISPLELQEGFYKAEAKIRSLRYSIKRGLRPNVPALRSLPANIALSLGYKLSNRNSLRA
jgi:radical SAM superfamily enzyme YgiQ (UPF0313 family)